jgi:hypothetical protein
MDPLTARRERNRLAYEQRRAHVKPTPRWIGWLLVSSWALLLLIGASFPALLGLVALVLLVSAPASVTLFRWWIPRSNAILEALSYDELWERLRAFRTRKRPIVTRLGPLSLGVLSLALLLSGFVIAFSSLTQPFGRGLVFLLIGGGLLTQAAYTAALVPFWKSLDMALLERFVSRRGLFEGVAAFGICGLVLIVLSLTRTFGP